MKTKTEFEELIYGADRAATEEIFEISKGESEKAAIAQEFIKNHKLAMEIYCEDFEDAEDAEKQARAARMLEGILFICRLLAKKCGLDFLKEASLLSAEEAADVEKFEADICSEAAEAARVECRRLTISPIKRSKVNPENKEAYFKQVAAENFIRNLDEARSSLVYEYFGAESKKEEIEAIWQIGHYLDKCQEEAKFLGIKFEYDFFAGWNAEDKAAAEEINRNAAEVLSLTESQCHFLYCAADIETNPEVLGLSGHGCIGNRPEAIKKYRDMAAEYEIRKAKIFEKINNIFEKVEKANSEKANRIRYFIKKLSEAIQEEKEISEKAIEDMIEYHEIRREQLKKSDGWY